MTDLLTAVVVLVILSIPIGLSVWALLDVASRPRWSWALCGRRQTLWLTLILLGTLSVLPGVAISLWYLLRVRPEIAAAELGGI